MEENFIKTIVSVTAGVYIYIFIKLCFRPFHLHQIYGHGQNNQTLYTLRTQLSRSNIYVARSVCFINIQKGSKIIGKSHHAQVCFSITNDAHIRSAAYCI